MKLGVDVGERCGREIVHIIREVAFCELVADDGRHPCSPKHSRWVHHCTADNRQRVRALLVDIGGEERMHRGHDVVCCLPSCGLGICSDLLGAVAVIGDTEIFDRAHDPPGQARFHRGGQLR